MSDALEIARGLTMQNPQLKKEVMLIRSRLADALINLHSAGVEFPGALPRDPLAKKTNPT